MFKIIKKTEGIRYADLAELTYEFASLNNAWNGLANIWKICPDFSDGNVFYDAIHTIMWGINPCRGDPSDYLQLVNSVADTLENCDEALKAWRHKKSFIAARDRVADTMDPEIDGKRVYRYSIIHYRYLKARMMCKLEYERSFCTNPKPCDVDFWHKYEAAVIRLIPSAANWNRAQWGDENNIHEAISAAYGIDFRDNWVDFDRFMFLAMSVWYDNAETDAAWYAMNITSLPYSLTKALWPNDTQRVVEELFLKAKEDIDVYEAKGKPGFEEKHKYVHATGVFDREAFKASWLFTLVSQWLSEGTLSGNADAAVKKTIFDLSVQ